MRRLMARFGIAAGLLLGLLTGVSASTASTVSPAGEPYADDRIVAYGWVGRVADHGWDCEVPVDRVTSITVEQGELLVLCVGLVNFSDELMSFGILRDGDIGIWDYSHVPLPPNWMSTFQFSYRADAAQTFRYLWHPIDASGEMLATFAQIEVNIAPTREPESTDVPIGPAVPGLDLAAAQALTVDLTARPDDGSDECATDQALAVDAGTMVAYCYRLTNVGNETLDLHDVVDSRLGRLVGPAHSDPLAPGNSLFYVGRAPADFSDVHVLSWDATTTSGTRLHGEDALAVIVLEPGIELDVTVGLDEGEGVCGSGDDIVVEPDTAVRYCYEMTNVGGETVDVHSLFDDQLGWLFEDDIVNVAPGESIVREAVAHPTESVRTIASWVSERQDSGIETAAADSVHVIVATPCPSAQTADASPNAAPIPDPTSPPAPPPSTTTVADVTTTSPGTTTLPPPPPPSTSTTQPVFAVLTTTTAVPVPAGFRSATSHAVDFAPTPCSEDDPGGGDPGTETTDTPDEGTNPPGDGEPEGTEPESSQPDGGDPGDSGPGDSGGAPGGSPGSPPAGQLPATGASGSRIATAAAALLALGALAAASSRFRYRQLRRSRLERRQLHPLDGGV